MPTPLTYSFSFPSTLTGNTAVNSLLSGNYWLGANWSTNQSSTNLSYSFISESTSYFATNYSAKNEYTDAYELTKAQQSAVVSALSTWSAVANIKFTLTSDNATNVGDLRFGGYAQMDSDAAAWAYLPDNSPKAGDVWIGPATDEVNPSKGSYDYLTFVHEIGHAIGLKHPFSASASNPTILDASLDDVRFTVMSYNDSYAYQPTTPMLLDILAIQSLYGANMLWQTGNNVYKWAPDQSVYETIWDAGGNDGIDASNQLAAVTIDLNEGHFSQIGKAFLDLTTLTNFNQGLAIAYGTKIENAYGSSFDDVLIGNDLDNTLVGLAGADTMTGGAGNDTYYVDNAGDTVIETGTSLTEIDTVFAEIGYVLGANVENLTLLGSSNLYGIGNTLNNTIIGNSGNNFIDGGAGADTLIGGNGDDIYLVENAQDVIIETNAAGSGIDTVRASLNWALGANLENLELLGNANLNGNGNELNNVLTGNDGNNILDGLGGVDTMIGGAGNDIYVLDQFAELGLVQELANQGSDGLYITYGVSAQTNVVNLNLSNLQNIENVTFAGNGTFTVVGNSLNNSLLGNVGINALYGGAGSDYLDGGAGADFLYGGTGNDVYVVDNTDDKIIEAAGEGYDKVLSYANFVMSDNIEDGQLLGSANISLTGNALNNTLTGNAGGNVLDGGAGADTLDGGAGNDTYFVDNIADVIIERGTSLTEIDTVYSLLSWTLGANLENLTLRGHEYLYAIGNTLNNTIIGNSGNNFIDGGAGADTLIGGNGDDIYLVENAQDVIIETNAAGSGIDTVRASLNWALGANLENLELLGNANLNGNGNELNNVLTGNDGDNILDGLGGVDTMIGGAGNDVYVLDQFAELGLVQELANQGSDGLYITYGVSAQTNVVNLNLSNLQNIENVTFAGDGTFTVVGNSLNNSLLGNVGINALYGGAGSDYLDGGAGADFMYGGTGNDVYVVDNTGDKVIEAADEGYDKVLSYASFTLSDNVEEGQLLGTSSVRLYGNSLNNVLTGNSGNNSLDGGMGTDILTGGAGADKFIFSAVNEIGLGANRDVITDFNSSQGDKIDLSWFDSNLLVPGNSTFSFIGANEFSGAGQLRFVDHILSGNVSGNAGPDFEIQLVGVDSFSANNLATWSV
ncbi:M10 family metallopeptidase [Pseudomonas nunensis]|uniref:Type I secretion C-terminal target domain-containing protein n=3 Tax=Pseudomonas nunensis TaxID=2961896 RepID=A0ABY5EJF3_9PSED|nr:M10 family metallopeptidase [Pseudomonas nunensis]KPN93355.1 hypothetical protein AL066_00435 [Pseudomonas nunensis]UTO14877.1 type I secretion C-terminal target domain-containing protein [Pseudomonas nunensis]